MNSILFVDDEPKILDGLKRMLRDRRDRWDMSFVTGAKAALAELECKEFDVIVTDMRMPEMDGAELLGVVKKRFPETVRFILSGYSEAEASLRAAAVAHQFLMKPCEAETLQSIVERACGLQDLLQGEGIRRLVNGMGSLPAVPRVYSELSSALVNPNVSLGQISKIVRQDVAISTKVLQMVNSAFFSLSRRVNDVESAVNLLGTNMLKNVTLSVEVFHGFEGPGGVKGFSIEEFQHHAFLAANVAKRMLKEQRQAEDAFMGCMLHEVGKLVLASRLPKAFTQVMGNMQASQRPIWQVEQELLGYTHAEIGAYLLGVWGLPYSIVEAVANHHQPQRIKQDSFDVLGAVYLANLLVHENEVHSPAGEVFEPVDEKYLESLGVASKLPQWREMTAQLIASASGRHPEE